MGKTVREVLASSKKKNNGKGGGAKKYGRHKAHCAKYKAEGRREKNKKRKMAKHLKMVVKKRGRNGKA